MNTSDEDPSPSEPCTIEIAKVMSCKYCNEAEDKQDRPGLICKPCSCFVHLTCLRRPGTPGDFTSDVFFEFTCMDCSPNNEEIFKRTKFPWVNVILLTLHHLDTQSYGISNHGFFHYRTHICSFIDRSWQHLFGANVKQKKNWVGTIAGVLSVYNNMVFCSGSVALGEPGWWKLMHGFSPAVASLIIQELAKEKNKGRPKNQHRNQLAMDKYHFISKVAELGFKDLINTETSNAALEPAAKKRRTDHEDSILPNSSYYDQVESDTRNEEYSYDELTMASKESSYSDKDFRETSFKGFDLPPTSQIAPLNSDSSSVHSIQQAVTYDSDTRSPSPAKDLPEQHSDDGDKKPVLEKHKKTEDKPFDKRESLFSTQLNSVGTPWWEPVPEPTGDLVEMTPYEEVQLLKQVENLIPKVRDPGKKAELHRLKAKLALRRLKRHKHLPIFDLDKAVKVLGGYVTEDAAAIVNAERVLDRFQRSYLLDNLSGTIASTNYGTLLLSYIEPTPFRSTYSGALLKPFIRRDGDSAPTWLKLTDELLKKTNRHVREYAPPPHATIDYSYVRPQHIAAVNNLCAQFFWPGIDLTEALQYPEFSCVVTYKKLVVGCAFLVPDAGPNEAYISFILTRPEWRNAKIGSFMLYHLLQTCSGKDVTLHVSPENPAIFLYQKFGFKVEELIQDFYEKYYDIDCKGCRHALFLRLIR